MVCSLGLKSRYDPRLLSGIGLISKRFVSEITLCNSPP
jgi:hypothetical protein